MANTTHPSRRGISVPYTIVLMAGLFGLASLGVEVGRVQLTKTELQRSADAAARAAAMDLGTSASTVRQTAVTYAGYNPADYTTGSTAAVLTSDDVELGTWDPDDKTFVKLSGAAESSASAVRVTTRKNVDLIFARALGKNSVSVEATAIAARVSGNPIGFIGLDGIDVKNNTFVGSYNPNTTTSPNSGNAGSKGSIGSNGIIDPEKHMTVKGDMTLGPDAELTGPATVTGTTSNLSSPIEPPDMPDWDPQTNPGGVSQNYTVGNSPLPGGTYWFTSITMGNNKTLSFSGPATVHLKGDLTAGNNCNITASGSKPQNLTFYQHGGGNFSPNSITITAIVIAPEATFEAKNNATFNGAAIFKTIICKNNLDMFFDETYTGGAAGSNKVAIVQ